MKRLFTLSICLLLALTFLAGCGAPAPAPAPTAPAAPASHAPPAAPAADMAVEFEADEGSAIIPIMTPADLPERRLIYTVYMELQTVDFMPGMRLLGETVAEMGGYPLFQDVRGRDMRRPPTERSVRLTFRVPSARLPEFLVVVEDNFNLWRLLLEAQDVTARYRQSESHLLDLFEQEQRLLEALEDVDNQRDRTTLENNLTRVQGLIRDLTMSQEVMDYGVIFSLVEIHLFEAFMPPEVAPPVVPPAAIAVIALAAVIALIIVVVVRTRSPKSDSSELPAEEKEE